MKTEMSARDIIILEVALCALIAVLMLRLCILPAAENRQILQEDLSAAEELQQGMQQKIDLKPEYEKRIALGREEFAKVSAPYYEEMESQEIDRLVTGLILGHNLFPAYLSIAGKVSGVPEPYLYSAVESGAQEGGDTEETDPYESADAALEEASGGAEDTAEGSAAEDAEEGYAAENVAEEDLAVDAVRSVAATITATGSREDVYGLLEDLKENYPAIQVQSFTISGSTYMDGQGNAVEEEQLRLVLGIYMCKADE